MRAGHWQAAQPQSSDRLIAARMPIAATPATTIAATSPRSAHSHGHAPPAPPPTSGAAAAAAGSAPEGSGAADFAGAAGAAEESGALAVAAAAWRRVLRTSKAGAMSTCRALVRARFVFASMP